MAWSAWAAAWCVTMAIWLLIYRFHSACARLPGLDRRLGQRSGQQRTATRIGLAAALAAMHARVRSGGSLRQSLQLPGIPAGAEPAGAPLDGLSETAASPLDYEELHRMLRMRAFETESDAQVARTAAELHLAYRLSEQLGCEAARSIQAVAQSHRRSRMVQELRDNAFAMPQATVKLLSALPFVTLLLGEIIGANPIGFLFGSTGGMACLLIGVVSYAAGVAWIRAMLRSFVRPPRTRTAHERPAYEQTSEGPYASKLSERTDGLRRHSMQS
ncbi:type II secretion system F family protein [Bifidobacterium subtile]|jgi:tight adherence protein B|uniref:Flp pilus assembly protein n=1 Tax=Bifidobacterium subtile TaxID=77635 RepID=A0A087E835_9BIFI|nr:hypothetical protein [Bifidobacterium subtile]KFJ03936.1 Flp pilus assembly protein [Bifidobacterium subtile]QOL36020.1 hypothetical protein BS3272_09025 [Bifidobacterium subtile]